MGIRVSAAVKKQLLDRGIVGPKISVSTTGIQTAVINGPKEVLLLTSAVDLGEVRRYQKLDKEIKDSNDLVNRTTFKVTIDVPIKLPSMANARLHWRAKASIVKKQRNAVAMALVGRIGPAPMFPKIKVTFTRLAARKLDDDNLQTAFKAVRDEVAAQIGIDDGSDVYSWEYRQEKAKVASVRIEIEMMEA